MEYLAQAGQWLSLDKVMANRESEDEASPADEAQDAVGGDDENLLVKTIPTMAIIIGGFGDGKSSLMNYLMLQNHKRYVGILLISNTGEDAWEVSYKWLNKRYIHNVWDPQLWDNIMTIGRRIKKRNENHHLALIFDDSIGMTANLFKSEAAKKLITTLRWYNISLYISIHQLQSEVTPLIRNQSRKVFLFRQTDEHGIKLMYQNWGSCSVNLKKYDEFSHTLRTLPRYSFMVFDKDTLTWTINQTPHPLPDWRLYLHPSDLDFDGMLLYGNEPNYDLSLIERSEEQIDQNEEDDADDSKVYRNEEEVQQSAREARERTPAVNDPYEYDAVDDLAQFDSDEDDEDFVEKDEEISEDDKHGKKKRKKDEESESDSDLTLMEQIESTEPNTEGLTKREQIIKHRLLITLNYIQKTPDNPDIETIRNSDPEFFDKDFNSLSFNDLKEEYKKLMGNKGIYNVIRNIMRKYDALKEAGSEVAKRFNYIGDIGMLTGQLDDMKHNAILSAISRSNPFKRLKENAFDSMLNSAANILGTVAPFGMLAYSIWSTRSEINKFDSNLETPMTDQDMQHYMSIVSLPPA